MLHCTYTVYVFLSCIHGFPYLTCGEPHSFRSHSQYKKMNNLYLPSAVFIAQVLVGPSKHLKHVKKESQLAGGEPVDEAEDLNWELPRNISRLWSERDLNPGPLDIDH